MKNFEQKVLKKLDEIISLLPNKEVIKQLKPLELEDNNFRVNSDGWEKITVDGIKYLQSPTKDIWELLEGEYSGEQIFTWEAAIRETKKAGKRMPTDEEWTELFGDDDHENFKKENFPNPVCCGFRDTNGIYYGLGSSLFLWSSTESSSTSAWRRAIYLTYSTVYRDVNTKTNGFSVRCLRD
jgi:hypothetical protein